MSLSRFSKSIVQHFVSIDGIPSERIPEIISTTNSFYHEDSDQINVPRLKNYFITLSHNKVLGKTAGDMIGFAFAAERIHFRDNFTYLDVYDNKQIHHDFPERFQEILSKSFKTCTGEPHQLRALSRIACTYFKFSPDALWNSAFQSVYGQFVRSSSPSEFDSIATAFDYAVDRCLDSNGGKTPITLCESEKFVVPAYNENFEKVLSRNIQLHSTDRVQTSNTACREHVCLLNVQPACVPTPKRNSLSLSSMQTEHAALL